MSAYQYSPDWNTEREKERERGEKEERAREFNIIV